MQAIDTLEPWIPMPWPGRGSPWPSKALRVLPVGPWLMAGLMGSWARIHAFHERFGQRMAAPVALSAAWCFLYSLWSGGAGPLPAACWCWSRMRSDFYSAIGLCAQPLTRDPRLACLTPSPLSPGVLPSVCCLGSVGWRGCCTVHSLTRSDASYPTPMKINKFEKTLADLLPNPMLFIIKKIPCYF